MALFTGCILNARNPKIYRCSIMRCHTLSDGMTPDIRIVKGVNYDCHIPCLGAPLSLLGDYYKRGLSFGDFSKGYLEYLRGSPLCSVLIPTLLELALKSDVEVCCIEEKPRCCHRRLLAEHIKSEFIAKKECFSALKLTIA